MKIIFNQYYIFLILAFLNKFYFSGSEESFLRISNGQEVSIKTVPYVLRLVSISLCTGALINESWVLTAAHCIPNKNYPEDIDVFAGIDDAYNVTNGQMRKGKNVIIHKDYWEGRISKYDFALLEVDKPFVLNQNVQVLQLSNEIWPQNDNMYARKCIAAGWGAQDIGRKAVTRLRALNVSARHGEKGCKCFKSFHNRRLVCLDDQDRGICQGDSGGALVCDGKGVGVAHMIYVKELCNPFAFGNTKLDCKDSTGAYMYICPFLDWMNEYVPSVPRTPANCRASTTNLSFFLLIFLIIELFYAYYFIFKLKQSYIQKS